MAGRPDPVSGPDQSAAPRLGGERQLRALEAWLNEQVVIETQLVTLPRSRRRYTMRRPDAPSRERLFAEARADPDKQMPHWTNIWPSGVALADVVLERATDVAGRRVLELGCGLGVTATAVLASGGTLVVSDYSTLSLRHCRYNALLNVGRSPRLLRFNWRDANWPRPLQVATSRRFPLILAADVLYEGRDVGPLLDVIERLLAPGGALWLAEPGRKTAQRFLNAAAAAGWESVTTSVHGPWPDGSTAPIDIHSLQRATYLDEVPANLGGWRI